MGRHSGDGRLVIEEDRLARCVTRDEQSGLFEELAQTGHVVGETALFERESARRVDVIQTHREPFRGRTWTQNFSHSENYADSEVEISRDRATTKFGVQTSQGASWPRPPLRRT